MSQNRIIDGLNCATVSRQQFALTLTGGVSTINLTIISPWLDLGPALAELARTLVDIEAMSDLATIVRSTAEIRQAREKGRLGIIMGTQNSALVEDDLALLDILYRLGFRILQPTYNERNRLGDGATVSSDGGLSELGRQWVHEMNRLAMLIDLSHCGYRTGADAIETSADPCIFSHANARALCDSPRNKPDELIRLIADRGGVTGAVGWTPALCRTRRPTIEDLLDQIEYLANLTGIEHVSFASDLSEGIYRDAKTWDRKFGRNGMYPSLTGVLGDWYTYEHRFPAGFESLAHAGRVWNGLVKRGYGEDAVEKIMGGNLMRVFTQVWRG